MLTCVVSFLKRAFWTIYENGISIQDLEKLPGDGYKNGSRDKEMYAHRLKREDFWIKKLRTIYPYGLNEK